MAEATDPCYDTDLGDPGPSAMGKSHPPTFVATVSPPLQPEPELTPRALLGGIFVGGVLCFSNMYFGLQTGWITMGSLQSALLGYGLFRVLERLPLRFFSSSLPFSAKENVLLQTTAVAVATMPLAGGFVGVIPALQLLSDGDQGVFADPSPMKLLGWCLALGFFGVFVAPPLRRQTILRERLPFPSGTATAEIIRQLHRLPGGSDLTFGSNAQNDGEVELVNEASPLQSDMKTFGTSSLNKGTVSKTMTRTWRVLFLCFAISSVYTLIGFFVPIVRELPVFTYVGLPALTAWSWTLQPSPSYFGQGMIMGPHTAWSMLLGALVGWAVLAPMAKAMGWAPGDIDDVATGARGWLLWVSLAMMLADSAVSLSLLIVKALLSRQKQAKEELDPAPPSQQISCKLWLPGLLFASLICTAILSPMFDMSPLQVSLAVLFSLLVAVLAVRALGETDLNPVSGIGKISQLLFAALAPGNVTANLVAGAVAEAGAMSAGDMMQDLKCGHLLGASPKAQFVAQLVGTTASCFMAVAAWTLYSSAYEIPGPEFPAPTALIWLDMAEVVNGGGQLPANVISTATAAATITALLPILEAILPQKHRWMIPSSMAAAIGMYVTPNWTLPRVAGGLANYAWHRWNPIGAERYMIVVASGFVLGEGLTSILNACLKSKGIIWVWCAGCPQEFCSGCS
ncbi:hypothetical protein ACHAWF_009717 [Thalassiosira exigua]